MPKSALHLFLICACFVSLSFGGAPSFELSQGWKDLVAERAPKAPSAEPKAPRKVLIFSLATGFQHWCIPHTEAVVEILGEQSGAYESVASVDVEVFRPERLKAFDAVVLNNNCPRGKTRDMFYDVLVQKIGEAGKKYEGMPQGEREALAKLLYRSLVDYVAEGGGLVLMHGAIANFSKSPEFSDLMGGHFVTHPPQQEVTLYPVIPEHPMLKPFGGKPFVHLDEPYILGGAYEKFNFAPMLEMETSTIQPPEKAKELGNMPRYVSWIKAYKKGRVFFSSPSHNAQSFERPELLGFILNGMQYAIGDLECDDQPMKSKATANASCSACSGCQ